MMLVCSLVLCKGIHADNTLMPVKFSNLSSTLISLLFDEIQMADKGVVSRFRGNEMHCNECIRVTIGTPEENRKFLDMLKTTYANITQ